MTAALRPWSAAPTATPEPAAAIIRRHSRSFALASQLLAPELRDDAHSLYAYCRRADDAIDLAPAGHSALALDHLRRELEDIYAGSALADPIAAGFQRVVFERNVPKDYPDALLEGFELDSLGTRYTSLTELYRYCWCVAGSVGAMMCHVLGVRRDQAVVHGAHLGMGMQLTNISRDVAEDWHSGRLYVPAELLPGLQPIRSWPPPPDTLRLLSTAVERLLLEAERFYRSGDAGLPDLEPRSRLAIATARHVYSSIGQRLAARDYDLASGRVVVPAHRKLLCLARGAWSAWRGRSAHTTPGARPLCVVRFPADVLPC
jgi:phytoene synthase